MKGRRRWVVCSFRRYRSDPFHFQMTKRSKIDHATSTSNRSKSCMIVQKSQKNNCDSTFIALLAAACIGRSPVAKRLRPRWLVAAVAAVNLRRGVIHEAAVLSREHTVQELLAVHPQAGSNDVEEREVTATVLTTLISLHELDHAVAELSR